MERSPAAPPDSLSSDRMPVETATAEVDRLLAAGKCKQAVELAKAEHKRFANPETERRLVHAYLARIEQFQSKGMAQEAATLLALVRERFPAHRDRLLHLEVRSAAAGQRVNDLVAPLAQGAAADVVACVEANIRQHLIDLPALAACATLPAEHPLRVAAGAVWRAFEAATTGPVTDEQIALPEVSRRSPLAAWKMLVRALGAFYRNDDPGCERALEAIPPDAAVARLIPVLRAMMHQTPAQGGRAAALSVRAAAFAPRVARDDRPLREALEGIERALRRRAPGELIRWIRDAVRACRAVRPALYERLRQHISIACMLAGVPAEYVARALGSSRKDAYFWRLMARASEVDGAAISAAVYWERFLRHAVHEGTVAEKGLEAAMVYLHAAQLLSRVSLAELGRARRRLAEGDVLRSYYADQPPEVAAVAPRSDREVMERVLSPGWFYERAAEIHPDPETFRQWWSWADAVELPDRLKEDVALRWSEKHPRDPHPLLTLSMLAERRNALKLALGHLAAAEKLDSLNPRVRQARVRLTLATTWRHFKAGKPHLVENDLAELEALPGMVEGDRAALVWALRAALHALGRDAAAARQGVEAVAEKLGPLAGCAVVSTVAQAARLPRGALPEVPPPALPDPHEVLRAEARILRLGSELGLPMSRPAAWDSYINDALRGHACPLSQAELLMIGRAAVTRPDREQAYLASAAGLATAASPAALAGFLLVRAQSLATPWGWRRAGQCLRAALKLARQAGDAALLREIASEFQRHPFAGPAVGAGRDGGGLSDAVLAEVLQQERAARSLPRAAADADRHLAIIESERAERGERGPFDEPTFDEVYDDDESADRDAGGLPDVDAALLDALGQFRDSKGGLPSPEALLRNNPKLLLQVLATIAGPDLKLDEATVRNLVEELSGTEEEEPPGFFARFFGRRGQNKKKRR